MTSLHPVRYSPCAFSVHFRSRIFQLSIFQPCSPVATPILQFSSVPFPFNPRCNRQAIPLRNAISYLLFQQSHKTPHSTKTAFHYTLVGWSLTSLSAYIRLYQRRAFHYRRHSVTSASVVTGDSYVRERLSNEQIQTASLLQECIMVRDGLARLPDVFTAGDMSDCSVFLSFFVYSVYN